MPADPYPPPPTLGMWSVGQNSTSSEHGHVTCQIKENHECSNMVANILPADTLRSWEWGQLVKVQPFQNMVMLRIKIKRITHAATW